MLGLIVGGCDDNVSGSGARGTVPATAAEAAATSAHIDKAGGQCAPCGR